MGNAWENTLRQRLDGWREQGLARELRTTRGSGARFMLDGQPVLSFASNDYLGLASHPSVIAATKEALERSGAGSGASPLISGHKTEHAELESRLAAFKGSEAALVFSSGYQAALAMLGALAGDEDAIILDRLAHASLIDGARLSGARVRTFRHNDVGDLAAVLKKERARRCIVAVESLYSMDGDIAPLAEIIEVARSAGALLLVDEAHATGVLGPTGRGGLEGLLPAPLEDVIAMGTLSKALGSQGGFICASRAVIDTIVHAGRAYLFSTALAPASAAAAGAALALIDAEPERRARLMERSAAIRNGLAKRGFNLVPSQGPIIPVLAGDESIAAAWSAELLKKKIFVPAIRYPTVKKGQARLRVSVSAAHTPGECEELLRAFASLRL